MFLLTPSPLFNAAESFVLTANPPASSDEFTICLPLLNRFKLVRNILLLVFKFKLAIVAVEFVFIDIAMIYSSLIVDTGHPCPVVSWCEIRFVLEFRVAWFSSGD
jgi:hypothetical protein